MTSIFVTGDGTLKSLLTAPTHPPMPRRRLNTGSTVNGSTFTQVQLDLTQRTGVLMQVPFLAHQRPRSAGAPRSRRLQAVAAWHVPAPPADIPMVEADTLIRR